MNTHEKHYHLIGIGGISMSGIAQILLANGIKVSGSDLNHNEMIDSLKEKGAEISIGHSPQNISFPDKVVISSAIPEDNPELVKAKENNIPILKRAELIAELMNEKNGIAVSGTHGKTTTTAMISIIFKEAKLDPTILLGGKLDIIGGNVQIGEGEYLITEADESDGSLLYFDPLVSVVTNIELDHLNYYDSEQKLINTFREFIEKPAPKGKSVVWADDDIIKNIISKKNENNYITYSFNNGMIQAKNINYLPFGSIFDLVYKGHTLGEINLQIPGRYNILNSLAAAAVSLFNGISFTNIKKGLEKFEGVKRRFEKKGLIGSVLVIDDYAHHPTEIKETLKAAKNTGYERTIAIFQPHRYSRTKHLFDDFIDAFDLADHLIITDIYSASEKPSSPEDKMRAKLLAEKIAQTKDFTVDYIESLEDILPYLEEIIVPRDLILTIGAGDIYKVGEKLIKNLREKREMA